MALITLLTVRSRLGTWSLLLVFKEFRREELTAFQQLKQTIDDINAGHLGLW